MQVKTKSFIKAKEFSGQYYMIDRWHLQLRLGWKQPTSSGLDLIGWWMPCDGSWIGHAILTSSEYVFLMFWNAFVTFPNKIYVYIESFTLRLGFALQCLLRSWNAELPECWLMRQLSADQQVLVYFTEINVIFHVMGENVTQHRNIWIYFVLILTTWGKLMRLFFVSCHTLILNVI